MNRRSFCGLAAAAGIVNTVSPAAVAYAETPTVVDAPTAGKLQELENDELSFTWFTDASARIVDRRSKAEWRMGPVALQDETPIDIGDVWVRTGRSICEQYPGRFAGRQEGTGITFKVTDQLRIERGSFHVIASLDGRWLNFRLSEIDPRLPSLVFPPPIQCTCLVLPIGIGKWIRQPLQTREFLPFFSRLNMRWLGGLAGDNCWMALFPDDNFVDGGAMLTEMSASPAWLKSLGEWTPRTVRYTFATGGYVQLARMYRDWAIANKLHRSLKEKIEETPALANLAKGRMISLMVADARHPASYEEDLLKSTAHDPLQGSGVRVNFTHEQARQVIAELPAVGLQNVLVNVRGWINGGYDYSHPDPFPPEPALGSQPELERICHTPNPITVALHDNYQDMYDHVPSWPAGVIRRQDGRLMRGGYWGGGQAYIINARDGLRYAERNWKQLSQLGPRGMFIDTTSAVQMYQCYEADNRLTRIQDMRYKQQLLQFFKSKGVALGSEEGADFAVPYADWFENRHARIAGETIPLWPLVFHDAVLCGRYTSSDTWAQGGAASGALEAYPEWLLDILWGYFLISSAPNFDQWPKLADHIRDTLFVDRWFSQIATAAMVDHRFLTNDCSLEMTSFSTGDSIVVNFSQEPLSHDGRTIPPHGYGIFPS
ncbi:MAG: DUF5696 domain-containing protein [Terracidiphilus sp.]